MIDSDTPNNGTEVAKLRTRKLGLKEAISKEVNHSLEDILALAKSRAPRSDKGSAPTWIPGALRRSGKKIKERGETNGEVTFGDENAPYAMYAHEETEHYHKFPTMPKFLERAADDVEPDFLERIKEVTAGVLTGNVVKTPDEITGEERNVSFQEM